jgi:branched-chain amino acid transport system ATP-binding protein
MHDGLAVLLVEQNVGQSLDIADRAYVLENAACASKARRSSCWPLPNSSAAYLVRFAGTPAGLLASDELKRAYLGI